MGIRQHWRNLKPPWYESPLLIVSDNVRRRPQNLRLVKLCSVLVIQTKERILKLKIVNAPGSSLERKDLNDPHNAYEILNVRLTKPKISAPVFSGTSMFRDNKY